MPRALPTFILLLCLFSSCTQRVVCPAFQSAFIYDQDELRKKFSYFKEDTIPKVYTASKNRYLVAEQVSYRKKVRSLQTVEMKPVYITLPDSLDPEKKEFPGAEEFAEDGVDPGSELDRAARSVIDSTYIEDVPQGGDPVAAAEDTVYVISKDKEVRMLKYDFPDSLVLDSLTGLYVREKPRYAVVHITFNVDQDNYMWYLKDYLVLPDVRLARFQGGDGEGPARANGKKARKKEGGFFKRLFGKKKKKTEEPSDEPEPKKQEEEFDFIDDEDVAPQMAQPEEPAAKPKRGLFKRRKEAAPTQPPAEDETPEPEPEKKKSERQEAPPADEEKAIPETLDEDGF